MLFLRRRAERKSRLKRKKDKLEARVLSFGDEEDEHEEEEVIIQIKKKKVGKNPTVDTSFLPDRDREVCDSLVISSPLVYLELAYLIISKSQIHDFLYWLIS